MCPTGIPCTSGSCQAKCLGENASGCKVDSDCCPDFSESFCISSPAGYCPVCAAGVDNPCVCCTGGECEAGGCGNGQVCTGGCGCGPCA